MTISEDLQVFIDILDIDIKDLVKRRRDLQRELSNLDLEIKRNRDRESLFAKTISELSKVNGNV